MDTGLMSGLAAGLQQGLDSYNQAKRYNEQKAQQDKLYKLQLLKAGVQEDESGGLIPRQGNAAYGESMRGVAINNYKLANPNASEEEINQKIPPNLLPEQYEKIGSGFKPALTFQGQNARAQSYEHVGQRRNDIAEKGLNLRENNSANAINKQVVGNPLVKAIDSQLFSLSKGENQLNSKDKPITNQLLNEIQADYANSLTGGRQAAQGTIHDQQMQTMQAKAANLKQYITGEPTQAASPQQIAYFKQAFKELRSLNQQTRESAVNALTGGAEAAYGNQGSFGRVIGNLKSGAKQGLLPQEDSSQDPKISQYAQQHGLDYGAAEALLRKRGYGK